MGLLFKIRNAEWGAQIAEIVRITGKEAGQVVKEEGKLFVADVLRMTPPFGKAPSTESLNTQRKVGEAATERDIRRVFKVINPSKIRDRRIRKDLERAIRKKDLQRVGIILKYVGARVRDVMPKVEGKIHEELRDKRGRVQRHKWIWLLKEQGLKGYIRSKKAMVGLAKSGWTKAARALGFNVPGWISRHSGPGVFIDKTNDRRKPMITVGNAVNFIQGTGAQLQIVQRALKNRTRNMRAKLERIAKSGWKKGAAKAGRR